jgi:hypothetical protein
LGRAPNRTFGLRMELRLCENPEVRRQVEAFEQKLLDRHLGLGAASKRLDGRPLIGVVERGKLLFPVRLIGYCSQVLVGSTLLSLRFAHRAEEVREVEDIALAQTLIEETALRALPPEIIYALLRGEGDVKEAERMLAMERLSAF